MNRLLALTGLTVTLIAGPAGAADGSADNWAEIIEIELARGQPMPTLSVYYDQLNLDSAYEIQHALVTHALQRRSIGGYKAGFTAATLRQKYRLAEPISGVLFADGAYADGADVDLGAFKKLMLETEVGFVLRSPITRKLRSVADLKTYISHAVPAIEMPDLNYVNFGGLNARDIVATNIASSHYLLGKPLPLRDLSEVNRIKVALYHDDQLIDQGNAFDAMGNQLEALLWLVNDAYARGWPLRAGHVLITGTIGKINPGLPGRYRADYGSGANVSFVLKPAAPAASTQAKSK